MNKNAPSISETIWKQLHKKSADFFLSDILKFSYALHRTMSFTFQSISADQFQKFAENFSGEKTFLQSSAYGVFRTKVGENMLYYGIFEDQKLYKLYLKVLV